MLPLRLFRDPVFSVSAAILLAAGFAMFGALSYLPLFLQVVHGVSATKSSVFLVPMVGGILMTSILSGQIISRTGRYKVFPVVGTAVLAISMFLLSRLDEHTPIPLMDVYFFVLGFGLGLIIQVLVIAVQNSSDYRDLGAATSGATFFRTIGGSFGVSIFGAIFASRLKSLLASGRNTVVHAYTLALQPVFELAVVVGVFAFVLSWFLREIPLRATQDAGAEQESGADAPVGPPADEMERALSKLACADIRRRGYERLAALAGLAMPAGSCWVLTRLANQGAQTLESLAAQAGLSAERGKPYVDLLVADGLVVRDVRMLRLTGAGRDAADRLFSARREGLRKLLAGWSPEQHAELTDLLGKLSRALVGDNSGKHPVSAGVHS
jgi:DNA-binding MarR family transcriptional regulator